MRAKPPSLDVQIAEAAATLRAAIASHMPVAERQPLLAKLEWLTELRDDLQHLKNGELPPETLLRLDGMPVSSMEGMVWKKRRNEWVLRVAGRAGADPKQFAIGAWAAKQEASFLAEQRRVMDPEGAAQKALARTGANESRKSTSRELAMKVYARAVELNFERGYRKKISREYDISPNHVSRLLKGKTKGKRIPD